MKVLITGKQGYIVRHLQMALDADTISLRTDNWKDVPLGGYGTLIHTAAMVHTTAPWEEWQRVNVDLTREIALKAKKEGISHFVFLSTLSVYGDVSYITANTPCIPVSLYGKSKLLAEEKLKELRDPRFFVSILRVPMVYGNGCPGNYAHLRQIALKTPILPKWHNQRSMVHIDNLCAYVRMCADSRLGGIFFPQNSEYVDTVELMQEIRKRHGKRPAHISTALGRCMPFAVRHITAARKAFGNLAVESDNISPELVPFAETLERTEFL